MCISFYGKINQEETVSFEFVLICLGCVFFWGGFGKRRFQTFFFSVNGEKMLLPFYKSFDGYRRRQLLFFDLSKRFTRESERKGIGGMSVQLHRKGPTTFPKLRQVQVPESRSPVRGLTRVLGVQVARRNPR